MSDLLLPGPSHAVVIRLTVSLDDAVPPVERELEVRGELTLDTLHEVLQVAMGWQDHHLHQFWRGEHPYQPDEPRFLTEIDVDDGEEGVPEAAVRVDQVLREPGDVLGYLYDFGDDWTHTLTVVDVRPASGAEPPARCLSGSGACPPEDVGGIHTYNELVAALRAPRPDAEQVWLREEYREWLPEGFDPSRFDAAATTAALVAAESRGAAAAELLATPVVALRSLAERFAGGDLRLLVELWTRAADVPEPAADVRDVALRPWQVLLEVLGTDGVALTAAGRLQPALVERLIHVLGVDRWWTRKVNREDQAAPIAALRESAQALRLVRRHQGRLVRSPAGRRGAGDPDALWQHLAAALPAGRGDFAQEAGAAWLLCLAAGQTDAEALAVDILTAAGWRVDSGRPIDSGVMLDGARATEDVLEVLTAAFRSADPQGLDRAAAQRAARPVVRALAARALRGAQQTGG